MKTVLINYLGRNNAGPLIALNLAKGLVQNNCRVIAVLATNISNRMEWDNNLNIEKIYVPTYSNNIDFILGYIKFKIFTIHKLKNLMAHKKVDIIIKPMFHYWAEEIDAIFPQAAIITICHDPIMHSGEHTIKKYLYKKHIKSSDYVIALTQKFVSVISEVYGIHKEKVFYVPLCTFSNYKELQRKDMTIEYSENKYNFLFFGRIEKYKGIQILLKAYKELKNKVNNISLTIVGKGNINEYEEDIRDSKDLRIYNQYIPDEEVGCYFTGHNIIVVLPYIDSSQSGVIPIAFEYNCPVIASDTIGLKEQLEDGNIGLLFKNGDIHDLVNKMEYIINNNELKQKYISKMDKYLSIRSCNNTAKAILDFLDK